MLRYFLDKSREDASKGPAKAELVVVDGEGNEAVASFGSKRIVLADELKAVPGDSYMCPYCRAVSDIADTLYVSTSASLIGDPVLGVAEQSRFLPTHFTETGLAIDSEGGICTDIACPRCHMSLPRKILLAPQVGMSIIGATGAGKSVFLASSVWRCATTFRKMFGIGMVDLDPALNKWINAYVERLFFQSDDKRLRQIEKTDLQSPDLCRTVTLGGDSVLMPLPSFFRLHLQSTDEEQILALYDNAGEHFGAGADTAGSAVTLNMINADVLFFMFDPSADPRFRPYLVSGTGTACNSAQQQNVLLAEMLARIHRHIGNRAKAHLDRPLVVGVSKADLLQKHLSLDAEVYSLIGNGRYALNLGVLRKVSAETESFLERVAPEIAATAHDISSEVWFIPVSALGHNPLREGVRPCDIKPRWSELPIVFTLAHKGLIPTVGEE